MSLLNTYSIYTYFLCVLLIFEANLRVPYFNLVCYRVNNDNMI